MSTTRNIALLFFIMMQVAGFVLPASAQEHPPRPVTLGMSQNMGFGAFAQGPMGGTVSISSGGIRSSTGDVILLNLGFPYAPAIFEVDANPGTIISISLGADITLTGSNGGTLSLHLEDPAPGYSFVTSVSPPATTQISVGGSLTVGAPAANPPGAYSGSFLITVHQE